jgi:hypothetical protein
MCVYAVTIRGHAAGGRGHAAGHRAPGTKFVVVCCCGAVFGKFDVV